MYVKEDIILPHTISFYDLIVNKAMGKSGPLFQVGGAGVWGRQESSAGARPAGQALSWAGAELHALWLVPGASCLQVGIDLPPV